LKFTDKKQNERETHKTEPMKNHRIITAITIITLTVIFSACRKDISLPDESLSKLFGNWEWVQTSGGFAGETHSPQPGGDTWSIEFISNGIFKHYKNGKKVDKQKYTIYMGTSILTNTNAWFISYDNACIMDKTGPHLPQTFRFGGEDSLFISDEAFDGYNYIYVRK
jgi:hypothetical protein